MSEEIQKNSTEFLLKEYDQSWDYLKFHYEQRGKCERFFFSMMLAAIGLVLAIWQNNDHELPDDKYLLVLITALFLLGLFTLFQLIAIRRTTTRFHKQIVVIRCQLKGSYATALWVCDDPNGASEGPRNFNVVGFNFFAALIIMVANAYLALLAYLYSGHQSFVWGLVIAIIVLSVQFFMYWWLLADKYTSRL